MSPAREPPRQILVLDSRGQPVPPERLVLGAGSSQRAHGVQAEGAPHTPPLPQVAGRSPPRHRSPSSGQEGGKSGGEESLDGQPLSLYRKVAAETPRNPKETRKSYRARVLAKVRSEIKDKKESPRAHLVPPAGKGQGRGSRGGKSKGKGQGKRYAGAQAKSKGRGRG